MATVQEIIDNGRKRSALNDANLTDDTALIELIGSVLQEIFIRAPWLRMTKVVVSAPGASQPWNIYSSASHPAARVEKADGTRVNVVAVQEPDAAFDPRLYRVGNSYYAPGTDPDPASDALIFFHPDVPTFPTATSDTIDTDLPQAWERLLEIKVAKWYAARDGRLEEAQMLEGEWIALLGVYDLVAEDFRGGADEKDHPV